MKTKFELGKIVMTNGIARYRVEKVLTFSFFIAKVLTKYLLFDIIAENKQGDDNCA